MTELRCFVVDAFTTKRFSGNPAAVVPLDTWPSDGVLLAIAAEFNLSETAFLVGDRLRWFTPAVEVDLCGHATLATAHVVLSVLRPDLDRVRFETMSGPLTVARDGDALAMDFPARPATPIEIDETVAAALGRRPVTMLRTAGIVAVFDEEEHVRTLTPDLARIAALPDVFAVSVTAPARDVDFVSRFFAPAKGVPEDPVTGSAHATLAPYWAARLGKRRLRARQVSSRGGEIDCEVRGDRVVLSGHAVLVLDGTLHV